MGWLNAKHALLQATPSLSLPLPRATLKSEGHAAFKSTKQPVEAQPPLLPPLATISIGRVNSAKVAGGIAPLPAHCTFPEPQSPVTQLNLPEESLEQRVLPHTRPDHDLGTERVLDLPLLSLNPVGIIFVVSGIFFLKEARKLRKKDKENRVKGREWSGVEWEVLAYSMILPF
nr:hypothetical protein ACMD2_25315 [Ipomoea trifida]